MNVKAIVNSNAFGRAILGVIVFNAVLIGMSTYRGVEWVNALLGKPVAKLLALIGIPIEDPAHAIPDYIVMCFIVAIFLALFLGLAARKRSLVPSKLQSVLEMIIEAFEGLLTDIIGEQGKKYLPMIGTIGLFILFCNLLGLMG